MRIRVLRGIKPLKTLVPDLKNDRWIRKDRSLTGRESSCAMGERHDGHRAYRVRHSILIHTRIDDS